MESKLIVLKTMCFEAEWLNLISDLFIVHKPIPAISICLVHVLSQP